MTQTQDEWERWNAERIKLVQRFIANHYPKADQNHILRNLWSGDEQPWDSCELEFFRGLEDVLVAIERQREVDRKNKGTLDFDGVDSAYFKDDLLPPVVKSYLNCTGVQSREASSFLIAIALDTELYPLRREAQDPRELKNHDKGLNQGIQIYLGPVSKLYIGGWIFQLIVVAILYVIGWSWLGHALLLYTLYGTVLFVWRRRKLRAALGEAGSKLGGFANALSLVRNEIASQVYNTEAIIRRLKALEGDGVFIPSYVFLLLDLERKAGA